MITYHFIIVVKNICVNISMLQIDHIYHFLFDNLYKEFVMAHLPGGVPTIKKSLSFNDIVMYQKTREINDIFFFYDQEPILDGVTGPYLDFIRNNMKDPILVTSEKSRIVDDIVERNLYYFFHGFAALDWFRGYYAINYNKPVIKTHTKDYISFNRTITGDRRYRKIFVDQLRTNNLLDKGLVSYGVVDEHIDGERLMIDGDHISASASASIPMTIERIDYNNDTPNYNAFWHIVTETVFYYDKLHLTEKIFKPIVSKQPFMLLAAPGNLEYLRSYGFKTFADVIDESYDQIKDNDARIEAVVAQIKWYCDLTDDEKTEIQRKCEPIVEHNFHHFYGKFKETITDELLDNTKKLFKDIGYNDSGVDYATVRKLLIS